MWDMGHNMLRKITRELKKGDEFNFKVQSF